MTVTAEALMGLFVAYGYWIVFSAILLDNAGLPIPGELLLLAVGIGLLEGAQDRAAQLVVEGIAFLRSIQGQAAHTGERRVDDERR